MSLHKRLLLFFVMLLMVTVGEAQGDCGVVDGVGFPVDTSLFTLVQDFAVPSSRHEGRYHTGEDWYGGRDISFGQAVRAAARGRVTFASPTGWGRDGGVVIVEHTFPNGDVFYTLYGHITETDAYPFPTRLSCVQVGDAIGAVADVRPAPHVHFEVRNAGGLNATNPGAGYSVENPSDAGFRNPSKFIVNQQTWLSLWHEWHVMIGSGTALDERGPSAPLLTLNDNSVLYLDGAGLTLRRATPDGRILWRIRLDRQAVAITAWRGGSLLTFADGTMQLVDVEVGSLGESWRVDATFTDAPLVDGNELLFPAPNNTLLRVNGDRREIIATMRDVPEFYRAFVMPAGRIVILTMDNQFRYYSADGTLLDEAQLRSAASFALSQSGQLLTYSMGGLWQIDSSGEWSLYIEDAPTPNVSGAMTTTDNRVYLFDGARLFAYGNDNTLLWQANVPSISGLTEISVTDNIIVITSNHGDMLLVNQQGGFCNQIRIFGQDGANQWRELGHDNIMRFAVADQIVGLDWETFTRPCN